MLSRKRSSMILSGLRVEWIQSMVSITSFSRCSGLTKPSPASPVRIALRRAMSLPACVRGPVERLAFSRFAAICRSVVIRTFLPDADREVLGKRAIPLNKIGKTREKVLKKWRKKAISTRDRGDCAGWKEFGAASQGGRVRSPQDLLRPRRPSWRATGATREETERVAFSPTDWILFH